MQTGQTISLNEILKFRGEDYTRQLLDSHFRCDKNADIQRFLLSNAIRFEQARIARTYLIFNDEADILAYFTLSFKSITVSTSKSQLRKLTGGLTNSNQVNAYLIGQIGKNSLVTNNPICLKDILSEILPLVRNGQAVFGGRTIILECENNSKLIDYYEKHGFKLIETDNETDLKTMYITPDFE